MGQDFMRKGAVNLKIPFAVCAEFTGMIAVVATGMIPVLNPVRVIKTKCGWQDIMKLVDFRPPWYPTKHTGTRIRGDHKRCVAKPF